MLRPASAAVGPHPTHCLVGHTSDEAHLAVVAPLWDCPGWYLTGDPHCGTQLAFSAAVRTAALFPVRHVRIRVFDPKMTGAFGPLAPLRSAAAEAFPTPTSDAGSFSEQLAEVMVNAGKNAETIGVAGASTLGEHWAKSELPEGTREVVVVLDYPYGVDARLHEQLVRLAATRGRTGVTLLVCEDASTRPHREVDPARLRSGLLGIEAKATTVGVEGYPELLTPPAPFAASTVAAVVAEVALQAAQTTGPTISLTRLLSDDLVEPWTHDSTDGLSLVIGESRRQLLELSLRTQNPPHPNMLVGGAVGQGKSNLLLDIIYSLAVRYSPDELEFHLLDFKQGLEFARFAADTQGQNWLPHAKVLSLESNLPFGVAVLRSIVAELERRAALLKREEVSNIDSLRAKGIAMTRLLLIVDEFHMLLEGDDDLVDESVDLLAQLAKQGRAYGIHLLLASQTISGIRSIATRGDAIFAQFPIRVSLKNTAQESQAILAPGNKAAADLTYRGEVIVNRNFGGDPEGSNVRGTAAFAEPHEMVKVQATLWQRGHQGPPLLFVATEFAPWDDDAEAGTSAEDLPPEGLRLVCGRPIGVTTAPHTITLSSDADQGVAVVGPDDELVNAAVAAFARSALIQIAAAGGEMVFLLGSAARGAWLTHLCAEADERGVPNRLVAREDIAAYLRDELGPRLGNRTSAGPLFVVGLGLQRARDMDYVPPQPEPAASTHETTDDPYGWSTTPFTVDVPGGALGSARSVLGEAMRAGALNHVFLVGTWSNVRTLEVDLGPGHQGVGHVITAGLGAADVKVIAGVTAHPPQGHPRIGHHHEAESAYTVLIPYNPAPCSE